MSRIDQRIRFLELNKAKFKEQRTDYQHINAEAQIQNLIECKALYERFQRIKKKNRIIEDLNKDLPAGSSTLAVQEYLCQKSGLKWSDFI